MMNFSVENRFSFAVQFTAEINCSEDDATSKKLGLAVKWALKNDANLEGANLIAAYLAGAYLRGVGLTGANLKGANLEGANLEGACFGGANLKGANLAGANLRGANLAGAYFAGANLRGAYFEGANLEGANLAGAYLAGADLAGASLGVANLGGANGMNDWVKCIQIETYAIAYTAEILQIGCESHPIADWRNFDNRRIAEMDGKTALKFWSKYRDWIFQTIALCPAKPTGAKQ